MPANSIATELVEIMHHESVAIAFYKLLQRSDLRLRCWLILRSVETTEFTELIW